MKLKFFLISSLLFLTSIFIGCQCQFQVNGIISTDKESWQVNKTISFIKFNEKDSFDFEILTDEKEQIIDGFGGCFNELGWDALKVLNQRDREAVLKSLFSADGCNLNICRMPIGANDFARNWYSLNDSVGDYEMNYFNIERDKSSLISFIKSAMKIQPKLKIWGSPWCPPAWMKKNGYYACSPSPYNDLDPNLPRRENGDTDFITDDKTQQAYALYFVKYIKAYQALGINVYAVHVQNEPHSCQSFPSCLWRGQDLKHFICNYLGQAIERAGLATEIWYSTFERPYEGEWAAEIDSLLNDERAMRYVKGFGFQWAGKNAIPEVHQKNPNLKLMHTETECGDGKNTWEQAEYIYDLIRHYFDHGVNAQMYWNMILSENPRSPWGWSQNSMITIDSKNQLVIYNPEFYVMKHFSHFIKPGAFKLTIVGSRGNELAFQNPNGEIILIVNNDQEPSKEMRVKIAAKLFIINLRGHSFNSVIIRLDSREKAKK